jgi:23S rRNA (cytosine1962-C5)-methyltransferase
MEKATASRRQQAAERAKPPRFGFGQLRLRVTPTAESILRDGHPWLYADSIRHQNRPGEMGELAVVYDRNDRFLALGLFDSGSAIGLRVLLSGKPQPVDEVFWSKRLDAAVRSRSSLLDKSTTGIRLINGESDGWPGLVLDRYDSTLVLKLYTAAWLPWLTLLTENIGCQLEPERIVLRLSRNIQGYARDRFGKNDGDILRGTSPRGPVIFLETGLLFEADVMRGQKTGFFLDQRENRRKVETLACGRAVLNAFSFSGAFSLYAARGGAYSVADLDISPHALAAAERNFSLNRRDSAVRECGRTAIQAEAFAWLSRNRRRKFDLIILDPPSLAKREGERAGAIASCSKLASLGIGLLSTGGILLACSCSAHVSEHQFNEAVLSAAAKSGRRFREIARTGQPADHPAAFEEAKYLKAIYLQVD